MNKKLIVQTSEFIFWGKQIMCELPESVFGSHVSTNNETVSLAASKIALSPPCAAFLLRK